MPYISTESFCLPQERKHQLHLRHWRYCGATTTHAGKNPHLHLTLDEYCKPSLGGRLRDRNVDQVFSKHELEKAAHQQSGSNTSKINQVSMSTEMKEEELALKRPRLLTVLQAWLWMIDDFVVSAFSETHPKFPKLPAAHVPENERDSAQFYALSIRIGLLLSGLVDSPNNSQAMGLQQTIFGIFESAISAQSDSVSRYLNLQVQPDKRSDWNSSKDFDFHDFDVMQEAKFLHDIGDIREELAMIKMVFSQQEEIWRDAIRTMFPQHWKEGRFLSPVVPPWQRQRAFRFFDDKDMNAAENDLSGKSDKKGLKVDFDKTFSLFGSSKWNAEIQSIAPMYPQDYANLNNTGAESSKRTRNHEGNSPVSIPGNPMTGSHYTKVWREIERPQAQFEQYKRRIDQLDESAARVEASIATVLDLKAKHASMKEAHSTSVMSAAVFGFTLVTIIFTPLSFMLSLFALPIQRLQDHQVKSQWGGDSAPGVYKTNYVGKFMGKWFKPYTAVSLSSLTRCSHRRDRHCRCHYPGNVCRRTNWPPQEGRQEDKGVVALHLGACCCIVSESSAKDSRFHGSRERYCNGDNIQW